MKTSFFDNLKQRHNKNTASNSVSGFTLVELMVATTIFTIIMLMGIGSLLVSSNSAKAAQKLRIAVDNVNFAMESMTRDLRTGTYYYCGTGVVSMTQDVHDCTAGTVIVFTPQDIAGVPQDRVAYIREIRANNTYSLKRCVKTNLNCSEVVSPSVNVEKLEFYVKGSYASPIDKIQPSVQIIMEGVVKAKDIYVPFTLQSMASQRSAEL